MEGTGILKRPRGWVQPEAMTEAVGPPRQIDSSIRPAHRQGVVGFFIRCDKAVSLRGYEHGS